MKPKQRKTEKTSVSDVFKDDPVVTYFYYVRGPGNRPTTTVCIVYDIRNAECGRGIATASVEDRVQRKRGRAIAEARARRALSLKENALEIRRWDTLPFEAASFFKRYKISFKSEISPTLSPMEKRMMAPILVPIYKLPLFGNATI